MIASNNYDWRIYNLTMIVDDHTHSESDGLFWIGFVGDKYDTQMDVTSVNDYDFTLLNIESFWINFDSFYENNATYSIYPNVSRNLGDVTKLIFVTYDTDRLYLDYVFIDGVSSVEITDFIEYQPNADNGGCSFMIIDYILNDFYNVENDTFCPFDNFDNEDSVFFQNSTSPTISPTTSPTSVPTAPPTTHPTSFPTTYPTTYPTNSPSSIPSTVESSNEPTRLSINNPTTQPSFFHFDATNHTMQQTTKNNSLDDLVDDSGDDSPPFSLFFDLSMELWIIIGISVLACCICIICIILVARLCAHSLQVSRQLKKVERDIKSSKYNDHDTPKNTDTLNSLETHMLQQQILGARGKEIQKMPEIQLEMGIEREGQVRNQPNGNNNKRHPINTNDKVLKFIHNAAAGGEGDGDLQQLEQQTSTGRGRKGSKSGGKAKRLSNKLKERLLAVDSHLHQEQHQQQGNQGNIEPVATDDERGEVDNYDDKDNVQGGDGEDVNVDVIDYNETFISELENQVLLENDFVMDDIINDMKTNNGVADAAGAGVRDKDKHKPKAPFKRLGNDNNNDEEAFAQELANQAFIDNNMMMNDIIDDMKTNGQNGKKQGGKNVRNNKKEKSNKKQKNNKNAKKEKDDSDENDDDVGDEVIETLGQELQNQAFIENEMVMDDILQEMETIAGDNQVNNDGKNMNGNKNNDHDHGFLSKPLSPLSPLGPVPHSGTDIQDITDISDINDASEIKYNSYNENDRNLNDHGAGGEISMVMSSHARASNYNSNVISPNDSMNDIEIDLNMANGKGKLQRQHSQQQQQQQQKFKKLLRTRGKSPRRIAENKHLQMAWMEAQNKQNKQNKGKNIVNNHNHNHNHQREATDTEATMTQTMSSLFGDYNGAPGVDSEGIAGTMGEESIVISGTLAESHVNRNINNNNDNNDHNDNNDNNGNGGNDNDNDHVNENDDDIDNQINRNNNKQSYDNDENVEKKTAANDETTGKTKKSSLGNTTMTQRTSKGSDK